MISNANSQVGRRFARCATTLGPSMSFNERSDTTVRSVKQFNASSGHSRSHIADARVTQTRSPTLHAYLNTAQTSGHTTALYSMLQRADSFMVLGCNWDPRAPRGPLASFLQKQRCVPQRCTTVSTLQGLSARVVIFPNHMAWPWKVQASQGFLPPSPRSRHLVWYQDSLHLVWCHCPSRLQGGGGAERLDHDLATWAAAPHPGAL
jgi:hypothetical protein